MSRSLRIVACIALLAVWATPGDAGPPNVVLILTDDLDVASTRVLTKTQRLVRDPGMDLRAHFATTPLCYPSRATLLTGLYAHNHLWGDQRAIDEGSCYYPRTAPSTRGDLSCRDCRGCSGW